MCFAPLIPCLHALRQNIQVLLICHRPASYRMARRARQVLPILLLLCLKT
jgi:hypothetical protein